LKNFKKAVLVFNLFLWLTVLPYLLLSITLDNPNPFYVVASQSMYPTLKRGDIILVRKCSNAYVNDIIVFQNPQKTELIVHRITKTVSVNGTVYYQTKGDNNAYPDYWGSSKHTYNGMISNKLLVGKVVYVIPYLGAITFFLQTPTGIFLTLLILALSITVDYTLSRYTKKF